MFGTLRFILALLVAMSHFGLVVNGFNPGQWAVVAFYILSGFLMERQVKKLRNGWFPRSFYIDRLLRIFPLYLAVLLLITPLFKATPWQYIQNVLLLPLNYASFTGVPIAVGPSWSLACEFQFYLLVPFLAALSRPLLRAIAACSFLLFIISPFLDHSTFWAYTGLPGILFTFCSGILLSRGDLPSLNTGWGCALVFLLFFIASKKWQWGLPTGIHINVLIGYVLFLPLIRALSALSPKSRPDRVLGLFSYPLFLCHEPVRSYANACLHTDNTALLLTLSVFTAGLLIVIVELPFDRLRYGIRKKKPS